MNKDYSKIPIKNIYYMLSYAWDILKPNNIKEKVEKINFDNIYNLLGSMLVNSVSKLVKKGLFHEYITIQDKVCRVKGQLKFNEMINQQCLISKKVVCEFDEFSTNNSLNGIIKYTLFLLLHNKDLDTSIKKDIKLLYLRFANIDFVKPEKNVRKNIIFNKINNNYILPYNISCLIYDGLLAKENGSEIEFGSFIKDSQMAKVFEKFVLNYYKKTTSKPLLAYSPIIPWQEEEKSVLLPIMRTDIVIENRQKNIQLIIDTKYYSQILRNRNYSDEKKLISNNMYQINTYVEQSSFNGKVIGMLLYPLNTIAVNDKFTLKGKEIHVRTIDLTAEWIEIKRFLDNILQIVIY